jgi:hypothetical protein
MSEHTMLGMMISCLFLMIIFVMMATNEMFKIYHGYEHLRTRYTFFFVLFGVLAIGCMMGFLEFMRRLIQS